MTEIEEEIDRILVLYKMGELTRPQAIEEILAIKEREEVKNEKDE